VGPYNGLATVLDEHEAKLMDVHVTLVCADAANDRWFGSVREAAAMTELGGHEVIVELPTGARGRVNVEIDLSGDESRVRLVGTGPTPI